MARRVTKRTIERIVEAPSRLAEDTQARVVKLESQYESLTSDIVEVKDEVQGLITRFDQFATSINQALNRIGRPQWGVVVAFCSLIFSALFASGSAGFTILKMSSDHGNELRTVASTFQDKVNDAKFKEVETQFRGVTAELETQIKHNSENNMRNDLTIAHLNVLLDSVEAQQSKNTQWREDFDKYVWPLIKPKP